eukprot:CAMPEP_0170463356 /NCGR_PEP_ID=MMETSP0123-20130129/8499_1 /TAXON_ID=182087 /ORGANISM="Favella ehrenbergii, Strain Fehren 1" /LENGTH=116 /DNA_ID=CAMNT_0010728769 /DNA_START=218 /DNA_END=568 /DNA_ORIENTATION=+
MCFLIHEDSSSGPAQVQMSTAAKQFNPFAAGGAAPSFTKDFVPVQQEEPQTAQTGIVSMLSRMGLDVQVDAELGTILIAKFENCDCCHGMINNCRGEICEDLGMCFCVSNSFHQDM